MPVAFQNHELKPFFQITYYTTTDSNGCQILNIECTGITDDGVPPILYFYTLVDDMSSLVGFQDGGTDNVGYRQWYHRDTINSHVYPTVNTVVHRKL